MILRGLNKGQEERNLYLEQSQNIFIFSAYTDACTLSCKIVVASKRPLIAEKQGICDPAQVTQPISSRITDQYFKIKFAHFISFHISNIFKGLMGHADTAGIVTWKLDCNTLKS